MSPVLQTSPYDPNAFWATFWSRNQSFSRDQLYSLSQTSVVEEIFENLSTKDTDVSRIFLGSVYAILSFALFANLAVVFLVSQILLARNQGASPNNGASFSSNHNTHILIYILALSIVDSLVLINAAVVAITIFFQRWIFHRSLCTAYYAIDSVNKTLSTFILTCMSLDRFLAVVYPQKRFRVRSIKGTIVVLTLCLSFAFTLLLPVYVQTDIIQVSIADDRNETTPTCAFVGEADFAVALAIFGFFAPLILMSVFYASMLTSLNKRRKRLTRTSAATRTRSVSETSSSLRGSQLMLRRPSIRVKTVTTRTLLLVLFHFGTRIFLDFSVGLFSVLVLGVLFPKTAKYPKSPKMFKAWD